MVITLNVVTLVFYLPFSYSLAISALVGSSLGKGNVYQAKKVALVAIALTSLSITCLMAVIWANSYWIVRIYTKDP